MYGRTVTVGMNFVSPDDDTLTFQFDNQAEADEALRATAMGHLIVTRRGGHAEAVVYMVKEELRRHYFEVRAVLKSMDEAAELVDREWARRRKSLREKNDQD